MAGELVTYFNQSLLSITVVMAEDLKEEGADQFIACVAGRIREQIHERWSHHIPSKPAREFAREPNSTLHQSSHDFATHINGFATKTLVREILPASHANQFKDGCFLFK